MANDSEYHAIIPVYMRLSAYSDNLDVKQSVWRNFPSFLVAPLQIWSHVVLPLMKLFSNFCILTFRKPFFLHDYARDSAGQRSNKARKETSILP